MKVVTFIFSLLLAAVLCAFTVILKSDRPEDALLGSWEKTSLDFERINVDSDDVKSFIIQAQNKEISHQLIVDQVDQWEFAKDHQLKAVSDLHKNNQDLTWKLKGRGNILEITNPRNNQIESYQVHELSHDKLVVYVNIDLQIRGIVKITFRKTNENYAKKI